MFCRTSRSNTRMAARNADTQWFRRLSSRRNGTETSLRWNVCLASFQRFSRKSYLPKSHTTKRDLFTKQRGQPIGCRTVRDSCRTRSLQVDSWEVSGSFYFYFKRQGDVIFFVVRFMTRFTAKTHHGTDNCSVNICYIGDALYAMTETVILRRIDPNNLDVIGPAVRWLFF